MRTNGAFVRHVAEKRSGKSGRGLRAIEYVLVAVLVAVAIAAVMALAGLKPPSDLHAFARYF